MSAITAGSNHLAIELLELRRAVTIRDDFSGAHEGEIQGIPEEAHPLASRGVVTKADILDHVKNTQSIQRQNRSNSNVVMMTQRELHEKSRETAKRILVSTLVAYIYQRTQDQR